MKSMTGYGEAAAHGKWAKVEVQLRTLNHRHLDIHLRVPKEYLSLEEEIRKSIRRTVSRGRVDLFITRSPLKDRGRRLELDEALVSQYLGALRHAKKRFGLEGEVDLSLFSSLPELFQLREAEVRVKDESGMVLNALGSALKRLERSREREGRQLKSDVETQIRHLRRVLAKLTKEAEEIQIQAKDLASFREGADSPDAARETAGSGNLFKGDIHEEVVRLESHVKELERLIRGRDPVGKKIDFLLQEVQRELNTIGSKVPQLPVVQLVLAGKERVEKIREQAQNVE